MQVWTDLCNRKCSYAAENDFMQVWTDLCDRKCSYASGINFMRVWTDLCNRKHSYASGINFMRVWTDLCNRKCSYATGNNFVLVWTNLCNRESFQWLTVGRISILNFPAKIRTGMCRVLLCGDWWWLITQPRPIWKKAPPGLQRPSRIATPSVWPSITLTHLTYTLDPTLKASGASSFATIRLLKKDK